MPQPVTEYMSAGAFFDFVRERDEKWELVDGVPVMMAGANQRHQAIAANIFASLYNQLRGKPCRPTSADTGVSIGPGTVRYPDVVVDCGRRDDESMFASEPVLVIEVLSPSTRSFDSHRKVLEYKSNPEIRYILLVDTNNVGCLLHYRDGEAWAEIIRDSVGTTVEFPAIGVIISLDEIYDGLDFKPRLVRPNEGT